MCLLSVVPAICFLCGMSGAPSSPDLSPGWWQGPLTGAKGSLPRDPFWWRCAPHQRVGLYSHSWMLLALPTCRGASSTLLGWLGFQLPGTGGLFPSKGLLFAAASHHMGFLLVHAAAAQLSVLGVRWGWREQKAISGQRWLRCASPLSDRAGPHYSKIGEVGN